MEMQIDRFALPAQRLAALMVDRLERNVSCQFGLARVYTHFTFNQWRDALEVQDLQSLHSFLDERFRAAQELGQEVSAELAKFIHLEQELAGAADDLAHSHLQIAAEMEQEEAVAEVKPAAARRTRRA